MNALLGAAPWPLLAQADGQGGRSLISLLTGPLLPFVMIGFLFYFLLIRPERRKRAELNRMLERLKKNDRVVTIGGIYGVVVNVQQGAEDVTIRVDDNTRLRVLRSAIARVIREDESSGGAG